MKTGQLLKLSEQELVDCSKGQGNSGCMGGWMHLALDYVIFYNGLQLASQYPYISTEGSLCKASQSKNIKGLAAAYKRIPEGDNDRIINALQTGMVPASVDSTDIAHYAGGVYDNKKCKSEINHAVVIVGYGVTSRGQKFWKVRNSWGESWGEEGYFRIAREDGYSTGICGINKYSVYLLG